MQGSEREDSGGVAIAGQRPDGTSAGFEIFLANVRKTRLFNNVVVKTKHAQICAALSGRLCLITKNSQQTHSDLRK
jgi:hypothetical protein